MNSKAMLHSSWMGTIFASIMILFLLGIGTQMYASIVLKDDVNPATEHTLTDLVGAVNKISSDNPSPTFLYRTEANDVIVFKDVLADQMTAITPWYKSNTVIYFSKVYPRCMKKFCICSWSKDNLAGKPAKCEIIEGYQTSQQIGLDSFNIGDVYLNNKNKYIILGGESSLTSVNSVIMPLSVSKSGNQLVLKKAN